MARKKPPSPEILRVFQSKAETRAFYDKIAGVYDLLAERSEEPVRLAGLEMLAAGLGERVLEIGAGTGHCLAALAEAVGPHGRVHGLDLSCAMLAASRGLSAVPLLTAGDGAQLPYASGIMDAIFMSFTLELFDTPEIPQVLRECRRVLQPRGRIVVVGMSKEGGPGMMLDAFEWTHRHFPNFLDCRPIYVRRSLEAAGFRVKDTRIMEMWIPVEVALGIAD